MKYDIILFDIDDTLLTLESDSTWQRMFTSLLAEQNLKATKQEYEAFLARNHLLWQQAENKQISVETVFNERFDLPFLQDCPQTPAVFDRKFQNMQKKQMTPTAGAVSCCQKLSSQMQLYTASNGKQETQRPRIKNSSLGPFFKGIYTSENLGAIKPQPEFFTKILQQIGCSDKSRVLMVGDTYDEDIVGAHNYGLDSCWLNLHQSPVPQDNLCTYQVSNLGQLPALIEE